MRSYFSRNHERQKVPSNATISYLDSLQHRLWKHSTMRVYYQQKRTWRSIFCHQTRHSLCVLAGYVGVRQYRRWLNQSQRCNFEQKWNGCDPESYGVVREHYLFEDGSMDSNQSHERHSQTQIQNDQRCNSSSWKFGDGWSSRWKRGIASAMVYFWQYLGPKNKNKIDSRNKRIHPPSLR